MLYDAYVKKVARWAEKKDAVLKYKVPIIVVLCVVLAALAGFIATRGMLLGNMQYTSELSYGTGTPLEAKALFGKPYYEYAQQGSNTWSTEFPSGSGSYKVRAVSDRSFGFKSYSGEYAFSVKPVKATVSAAQSQITYGSVPTASGNLQYEDRIESAEFKMSSKKLGKSVVRVIESTIKVVDKNGNDVTSAYVFETPEKTVEIIQRLITVTLHDAEKEYDGRALTCSTYESFNDQLAYGHKGYVTLKGSQTEAGTSMNTIAAFKVYDGNKDVTSNYDFTSVGGSLTVTPRKITVLTGNAQRTYDGKPVFNNLAVVASGRLLNFQQLFVAENTEVINAGVYDNVLDVKIVDKNSIHMDYTANYDITYQYGKLTVSQKKITIMPKMITREYDGTPLHTTEATVVTSSLAEGDTIILDTTGSITEVGSVSNEIKNYKIMNGANDVTGNYSVSCQDSSLTVIKRAVVVKPLDMVREYDATPLTSSTPECTAGSIAPGQTMVLQTVGSITTVGVANSTIVDYKIFAGGEDVTANYNVITRTGSLVVNKRAITITANSASKIYDTKPLSNNGYSITSGSVVGGQILTVTVEGSQTLAGESENRVTSWRVTTADYQNVSSNYAVTLEAGVIRIDPRPITVKSGSASKMYDGTELTNPTYTVESGTLVKGHSLVVSVIGARTDAGISPNVFEKAVVLDGSGIDISENYAITKVHGELNVKHRPITVVCGAERSKIYDGKQLITDLVAVTSDIRPVIGHEVVIGTNSDLVGVYDHTKCVALIVAEDGKTNVTANYEVTIAKGQSLSITPFSLMIKPQNAEREYDGTPLTCNIPELINPTEIPEGHVIFLTTSGSAVNVLYNGDSYLPVVNRITDIVIQNSRGEDVTSCFSIMKQVGTLVVTPRVVTVKPMDEVKEYDGTALMGNTPEFTVGSAAPNQTVLIVTKGSQTEIGSSENVIIDLAIMDANLKNVKDNYKITIEKGTLTVTTRKLVISPVNVEKIYDGTPIDATEGTLVSGSLLNGHVLDFGVEGTQTDAGTSASRVIADSVTITMNGKDVSHLYTVVMEEGTVTVIPRPITVEFDSLMKIYDAKKFTSESYKITSELQPLDGHLISISSNGASAGTYGADAYTISVYSGETDMTANYNITHDGVITIQKRPLALQIQSALKEFDGRPLTTEEISATYSTTLVPGHSIEATTSSALPGVYTYGSAETPFFIRIYVENDPTVNDGYDVGEIEAVEREDLSANYEISIVGAPELVIGRRALTVDIRDAAKLYDTTESFDAAEFIVGGSLAEGHSFIYKNIGGNRAGLYTDLLPENICVLDALGLDVTANYDITFTGAETFSVEILKRAVNVTLRDMEKPYDATPNIDVTEEGFVDESTPLLADHRLVFVGTSAELGAQTVSGSSYIVIDRNGVDVTDCYELSVSGGSFTLTTVQRQITIKPTTVARPYNGKELFGSNKADVISTLKLIDGHTVHVVTEGSQTEIGDGVLTIKSFAIYDENGNDVTEYYNVTCNRGTVRVLRLSLVLATSDANITYTGNAVSSRGVTVFIGELMEGHVIYDADAQYAEVSNIGTFQNTVSGVRIHDENGNDVTEKYYNVTYRFGTLTVTEN